MTNIPKILNWNIRGYYTNQNELQVLINDFTPTFICLQETKLKYDIQKLKNYSIYSKNKTSTRDVMACGGVMTLIHKNVYSLPVDLDTNLQAVAVQISFPYDLIICNIYLEHNMSSQTFKDELEKLIAQLGHSFIITGDFNAHNTSWGSHKTDRRGSIITELTEHFSLTILNEKLPTHVADSNGRMTSIDLTLCTQNLIPFTDWTVLDDLHGSDHFPILISFPYTRIHETNRQVFNTKKANWTEYQKNLNFDNIDSSNIENMERDFTNRIIHAAKQSIPLTRTFKGK